MTQTEIVISMAVIAALCIVVFVVAAIRLERREQRRAEDLTDPRAWEKRVILGRPKTKEHSE